MVFTGWQGRRDPCHRIPTIIRTSKSTLLAFAELRQDACSDAGNHDIVLRRSTDDGLTWGESIVIARGNGRSLSNPNPVEVDLKHGKFAVLLHYDTMNNPSSDHHGENIQAWSHDDGLSWGDFEDITKFMPNEHQGCMPGPSVGVQAPSGSIYFSCHPIMPSHIVFLYWSEDFGKTWRTGDHVNNMDECSLALLPNSRLAMNCRIPGGRKRAQITWSEAGKVISGPHYPAVLSDPGCQGSLLASPDGKLYLSHANSSKWRQGLTVRCSHDEGNTWSKGQAVWKDYSAYSQLVSWMDEGEHQLGLLFEHGGRGDSYAGISFRILDDVCEGKKHAEEL